MTSIIPIKPFGKDLSKCLDTNVSDSIGDDLPKTVNPSPSVPASGDLNGFVGDLVLRGIRFSHSSKNVLNVLDSVIYAKSQGGVLQSLDAAVFVRDHLDVHPVSFGSDPDKCDRANEHQITSSFATYGLGASGSPWVGVWDLESVFGGDLDKHVEVVTTLSHNYILDRRDPLMQIILSYLDRMSRIVNVPDDCVPYGVLLATYDNDPVAKNFLPQCVNRNVQYLQRKGCSHGTFFLPDKKMLKHLKGTTNVETRACSLGSGIDSVYAVDFFVAVGRSRGVALGKNDFNKVSP